jgi:cation transporter-like permease
VRDCTFAGIASSTLQISTALSVAVIGGIFYTLLGTRTDEAAIVQAFAISILCIAGCLLVGVLLSVNLARRPLVATVTKSSARA